MASSTAPIIARSSPCPFMRLAPLGWSKMSGDKLFGGCIYADRGRLGRAGLVARHHRRRSERHPGHPADAGERALGLLRCQAQADRDNRIRRPLPHRDDGGGRPAAPAAGGRRRVGDSRRVEARRADRDRSRPGRPSDDRADRRRGRRAWRCARNPHSGDRLSPSVRRERLRARWRSAAGRISLRNGSS